MTEDTISRRTFVKGAGVTTGLAVAGVGSTALDEGPVQEADAIAPVVLYAAGVGLSVAVGWALREFEIVGSNPPPTGLTAGALEEQSVQTARARKSTNASTIVDNKNILQGIENSAYADAKIAAIEQLNQQATQQAVKDAATAAVNTYEETIITNFLRTWGESVRELDNVSTLLNEHSGTSTSSVFDPPEGSSHMGASMDSVTAYTAVDATYTFTNGESITVPKLKANVTYGGGETSAFNWGPHTGNGKPNDQWGLTRPVVKVRNSDSFDYLDNDIWLPFLTDMEAKFDNVRNGIILWVDNVYGQVQAGELDTTDLLTPRELAAMSSDAENYSQAVADLMALNISTDLEREAKIKIPSMGVTLTGRLMTTADTTLTVGTIDPAADAFSYYFTYDVSKGEGVWTEYNTGIDGGYLTFTAEPYPKTEYHVNTTAGETATVTKADFTDNGDGTWTVSLSSQLENAITNVDSITFTSKQAETFYDTVKLTEPFEVIEWTDSEGNTYTESTHTSAEPHTDTNYITAEEWEQQEQRYLDLIEKYEASQSGGGAAETGSDFLASQIMGVPIIGWIGGIAALVAAAKAKASN